MYRENQCVHAAYMPHKKPHQQHAKKQLRTQLQPRARSKKRWRPTKLQAWRNYQDPKMTQQKVVDLLAEMDPPITIERATLSRYETGEWPPSIAVLEPLARLYGTNVDWMLNRDPKECVDLVEINVPKNVKHQAIRLIEALIHE